MTDIPLDNAHLQLSVALRGGSIWLLAAKTEKGLLPLLREPPSGADRSAADSACFPFVPFGNRVSNNRFVIGGVEHLLSPNTTVDRHYLHGDGWLARWSVRDRTRDRLILAFSHGGLGSPYTYDAIQTFALRENTLVLTLGVTNRGAIAMPFGLGWHPFFPLTRETTLQAGARSFWLEGEGWLPTHEEPIPPELDFTTPKPLPGRWVNNGFEGWNGLARIEWPERNAAVTISAGPPFQRYFLFLPDRVFDPSYNYDYFCFEPMSHSADAHNGRGGGLVMLAPGESASGEVRLTFEAGFRL